MSAATPEQRKALEAVIGSIVEVVQAHGDIGMPSGHLYALLMGFMRLDQYESLIDVLIKRGVIARRAHVLFACQTPQEAPDA